MSNRTQKEGRFYHTEKDFAYTPIGDLFRDNNRWQFGLLSATRVCDPTYDRICNMGPGIPEEMVPIVAIHSYSPDFAGNIQVLSNFGGSNNWEVYGEVVNYDPAYTYTPIVINDGLDEATTPINSDGTFSYTAVPPMSDDLNGTITVKAACSCQSPSSRTWLKSDESVTAVEFIILAVKPTIALTSIPNDFELGGAAETSVLEGTIEWDAKNKKQDFTITVNGADIGTTTLTAVTENKSSFKFEFPNTAVNLGSNEIVLTLKSWNPDFGGEDTTATSTVTQEIKGFQIAGSINFSGHYPHSRVVGTIPSRLVWGMTGAFSDGAPIKFADVVSATVTQTESDEDIYNTVIPHATDPDIFGVELNGMFFHGELTPFTIAVTAKVPGYNATKTFTNSTHRMVGLDEQPTTFEYTVDPLVVWLDGTPVPVPDKIVITGDVEDIQFFSDSGFTPTTAEITIGDNAPVTVQVNTAWPATFSYEFDKSQFPTEDTNLVATFKIGGNTFLFNDSPYNVDTATVMTEMPFFKTVPDPQILSFETGTGQVEDRSFEQQSDFTPDENIIFRLEETVPTKNVTATTIFGLERSGLWDWQPVTELNQLDMLAPDEMSSSSLIIDAGPFSKEYNPVIPFEGGTYRVSAKTQVGLSDEGLLTPDPANVSEWVNTKSKEYTITEADSFIDGVEITFDQSWGFAVITPDTDARTIGPVAGALDTFRPGKFSLMVNIILPNAKGTAITVEGMQLCEDTPNGIELRGGDSLVSVRDDPDQTHYYIQFFSESTYYGSPLLPYTNTQWTEPKSSVKFCILFKDPSDPANIRYYRKYFEHEIATSHYPGPVTFSTNGMLTAYVGNNQPVIVNATYDTNLAEVFDNLVSVTATNIHTGAKFNITNGSWYDFMTDEIYVYPETLPAADYKLDFEMNFFNYVAGFDTAECDTNGGRICRNSNNIILAVIQPE